MNLQEISSQELFDELVKRNASFPEEEDYSTVWRDVKGRLHRLDGPAIEYNDGLFNEWWVNGKPSSKENASKQLKGKL